LIRLSFFCFHSFLSQQVNPKALNTTGIDCKTIYDEEVAYAENFMVNIMYVFGDEDADQLAKFRDYSNCLIKIFRDNDFIEKLFAFDFLGEKEYSPLEKDKLRRDYVAIHVRLSHEVSTCAFKH
jgi:hypothetical protein